MTAKSKIALNADLPGQIPDNTQQQIKPEHVRKVVGDGYDSAWNVVDNPDLDNPPGTTKPYFFIGNQQLGYRINQTTNIPEYTVDGGASWIEIGKNIPAVAQSYPSTIDMIADQSEQEEGQVFFVTADGFYYEYLGTTAGTIADYRIQSQGDIRDKPLTITAAWEFETIPVLPDEDPEGDNDAVRKRYVDNINESLLSEIESLKNSMIFEEFTYSGSEHSNKPCVFLARQAEFIEGVYIKAIGEIFPSEYEYIDEYRAILFEEDSLIDGDRILVKYYKNKSFDFSPYDLNPQFFDGKKWIFSGSNYQNLGNLNAIWNSATYEVWFLLKPTTSYQSATNVIMGLSQGTSQYFQINIFTSGTIRILGYWGGANNLQLESIVAFTSTEHKLVRLKSNSSGTPTLEINGVISPLSLIASAGHTDVTIDTFLGARNLSGVASNHYTGMISDLLIISRLISPFEESELKEYYNRRIADTAPVVDVFCSFGQSNEASRGPAEDATAVVRNNHIMIWAEPDQGWQTYNALSKNNLITAEQALGPFVDWIAVFGDMYFKEHEKPAYFIKYAQGGTGLYINSSTPDWNASSSGELLDSYLSNIATAISNIGGIQVFISNAGSDSTGNGSAANPYKTEEKARETATDARYTIIRLNFHSFHQGERDATNLTWANAWNTNYIALRNKIRSSYLMPCIINTIHPNIPVGTHPYSSQVINNQESIGRYIYRDGTIEDQANGADENTIINDLGDLELLPDQLHITAESQQEKGKRLYQIWKFI